MNLGSELQPPKITAAVGAALSWSLLIGGVAGCAQIAQVLMTKGLHAERAGRAMAVTYLQIVFAALWGMLFFHEVPDLLSVAGGLLVIGGTVLAAR